MGDKDPDCRRGFPDQSRWDLETWEHHKKLIALRHKYPALRTGNYKILFAENNVFCFVRQLPNEPNSNSVVIAINSSDAVSQASFYLDSSLLKNQTLVYGEGSFNYQENNLEVTIPPRQQLILV